MELGHYIAVTIFVMLAFGLGVAIGLWFTAYYKEIIDELKQDLAHWRNHSFEQQRTLLSVLERTQAVPSDDDRWETFVLDAADDEDSPLS